jgi:hypothetical protein
MQEEDILAKASASSEEKRRNKLNSERIYPKITPYLS